jgi:hypothetical protein
MDGVGVARRMWELGEPVHDLVYFSPEAREAADGLGMRGFWMGYFALRAAPLGPVPAAVVTGAFYVFHPARVAGALPDAWGYADPAAVVAARERAMDAALTRVYGAGRVASADLTEAADLAWRAAEAADTAGRVLGAANQALDRPALPHVRLWQALTTLREHRGDGHIAVLVAHGVGPVAAMVLKVAAGESDADLLRLGRKWDAEAWGTAVEELRDRVAGRDQTPHRARCGGPCPDRGGDRRGGRPPLADPRHRCHRTPRRPARPAGQDGAGHGSDPVRQPGRPDRRGMGHAADHDRRA